MLKIVPNGAKIRAVLTIRTKVLSLLNYRTAVTQGDEDSAIMPGDFQVSFGGVVRGFHVYQAICSPVVGEALSKSLRTMKIATLWL